jgi:hypothetical protein
MRAGFVRVSVVAVSLGVLVVALSTLAVGSPLLFAGDSNDIVEP